MTISTVEKMTISIPDAMRDDLDEYASRLGMTRSQAVRLALSHMLGVEAPVPYASRRAARLALRDAR